MGPYVHRVPARQALRTNKARAKGIEKDLEYGKERLASNVVEQHELEPRRQISVDAILTEILVVLHVVALEHHCVRDRNGQVDKYCPQPIGTDGAKSKIVGNLVDG